jgi:hypothetical protein
MEIPKKVYLDTMQRRAMVDVQCAGMAQHVIVVAVHAPEADVVVLAAFNARGISNEA